MVVVAALVEANLLVLSPNATILAFKLRGLRMLMFVFRGVPCEKLIRAPGLRLVGQVSITKRKLRILARVGLSHLALQLLVAAGQLPWQNALYLVLGLQLLACWLFQLPKSRYL